MQFIRFAREGKICFLRLAPVEEKLENNVIGEIAFIDYLLKHHYPALEPIETIAGQKYLKLNTEWGEYYATAFQRVSGVQIEDTDMSNEILYEYGKTLGRLHSLSAEFMPKTKKWTHIEVLNCIQSVFFEYNTPKDIALALAALKDELSFLPLRQNTYGLIHYDLELDNVFYDKKTKSCAVIDSDDGVYHWYALDIQQVFDSLANELSGEALEIAKSEFVREYEEEHCYTEEMEGHFPLCGVLSICMAMRG